MSSPTFVYCFTKRIATSEDNYAIALKVFRDSVNLLSKHYKYRIYTDSETYLDIVDFGDNITLVNTDSFYFVDDFKIYLLDILSDNEVIIDPDVLIYNKLSIDYTKDLIFCHKDFPYEFWYQDHIESVRGSLLYSRIKIGGEIPFVPNLGFLKIPNKRLRKVYTNYYASYRADLLNTPIHNTNGVSILLGQYLLGILLYEGNYSYFNHKDNNSREVYVHLAGPQKFELYK